MSREKPTRTRRPIVMHAAAGTTISIGNDVLIEIHEAYRGRALLHVYAPNRMDVDRERNFCPAENNDGPSVGALEPSANQSPASTKI